MHIGFRYDCKVVCCKYFEMSLYIFIWFGLISITTNVWVKSSSETCRDYIYERGVHISSPKDNVCTYNIRDVNSRPYDFSNSVEATSRTSETCRIVKYHSDSPECADLSFPKDSASYISDYRLYLDMQRSRILNLGLEMSHIQGKYIQYHMQRVTNNNKNLCREINLEKVIRSGDSWNISILCRELIEAGTDLELYVSVGNDKDDIYERSHFLFHLPDIFEMRNCEFIETWKPFLIVDITRLPELKISWEPVPNVSDYTVQIQPLSNDSSPQEEKVNAENCKNKCEVVLTVNNRSYEMIVAVYVGNIQHEKQTCVMKSPSFVCPESSLIWLYLIPVLLVPVLLISGALYWRSQIMVQIIQCYRSRRFNKKADNSDISCKPKELKPLSEGQTTYTEVFNNSENTNNHPVNNIPYHSGWLELYENKRKPNEQNMNSINIDELPL